MFRRSARTVPLVGAAAIAACAHAFDAKRFTQGNDKLFAASLREYQQHHWENAVAGFEKLTLELGSRDSLLPRSYFYLAHARGHRHENLLAAQAFTRLAESFPDDSLADDAVFGAGRSYEKMWRRPDLDSQYGTTALQTFRTLNAVYPASSLRSSAEAHIGRLEEWFARKDYENGMHYYRRKAFDSAILYFRGVTERYPNAPSAKRAWLRLVDSFRAIRYKEDMTEACATLNAQFPGDREVVARCGPPPVAPVPKPAATTPSAPPTPTPPATTPPVATAGGLTPSPSAVPSS